MPATKTESTLTMPATETAKAKAEDDARVIERVAQALEAAQDDLASLRGSLGAGALDLRKDVQRMLRDSRRDLKKMSKGAAARSRGVAEGSHEDHRRERPCASCRRDGGQDDPAEDASGVAPEPQRSYRVTRMVSEPSSFLNCPRRGLSIRPKISWLTVEHCPRCIARARMPVKLFSSTLPALELYSEGSVPNAERRNCDHVDARSR